MHKRGIIRYANYTVCASVFIHFCMQRKNNENIPIIKKRYILEYLSRISGKSQVNSPTANVRFIRNVATRF